MNPISELIKILVMYPALIPRRGSMKIIYPKMPLTNPKMAAASPMVYANRYLGVCVMSIVFSGNYIYEC
jgi:hypothetical protein